MNILAFDTSSPSGSIALCMNGTISYVSYFDIKITHSETLLPYIDECLKMQDLTISDIDKLIVTIGPGSFTGLRIGLASAKGIAMAREIPLITYSTLLLLASNCYGSELPILAMIDAKMNEIYYALYTPGLVEIIPPATANPNELLTIIKEPVQAVGSGFLKYGDLMLEKGMGLKSALPHQHLPLASGLLSLYERSADHTEFSFETIANLEPLYLRKSQAEVAYEKKNHKSLT